MEPRRCNSVSVSQVWNLKTESQSLARVGVTFIDNLYRTHDVCPVGNHFGYESVEYLTGWQSARLTRVEIESAHIVGIHPN